MDKQTENKIRDLITEQEVYEKLIEGDNIHLEQDPESLMIRGNFFWAVGDFDKCIEYYKKSMDACKMSDIKIWNKICDNLEVMKSCCKSG